MQRYWSLERLRLLVEVLKRIALFEGGRWYLSHDKTAWAIHRALYRSGFRHTLDETHQGLYVLLHLGVIASGRTGPHPQNYRRLFYPDVMESVTLSQLEEHYRSQANTAPRQKYQQPDDPSAPLRPGVVPGMEFWTAARLNWLIGLLRNVAEHDPSGWYFGPTSMRITVYEVLEPYLYRQQHVDIPIAMLVFSGVLAPGKSGSKPKGYRRPFYPDVVLTDDDAFRYCQDARRRFGTA